MRVVVRKSAGLSLLELLVVLALASILVAIVFPSIGSGIRTLELRTSAQRLAAAVRYTRDYAVFRQTTVQLEIDGEAGRVAIVDLQGGTKRNYEFPDSVQVASILPLQENPSSLIRKFVFTPDGATPMLEVVLSNRTREILVVSDPLTGAAKVVE